MLIAPKELVKRMFSVYRTHWTSLFRYVGLTFLSLFVLGLGILISFSIFFSNAILSGTSNIRGSILPAGFGYFLLLIVFVLIAFAILNVWITVGFIRTTQKAVLDQQKAPLGAELKESRPFVWRSLGSGILAALISMLPFYLGIIPLFTMTFTRTDFSFLASPDTGFAFTVIFLILLSVYGFFHLIYFSVVFFFAPIGVVTEGWGVRQSLKKSKEMVKGKWWPLFGRMLVSTVVIMLPLQILSFFTEMQSFVGSLSSLLGFLYFGAVVLPMSLIPSLLLYHSLKGDLPDTIGAPQK